jgi:predicted DNA-binding protein (UPF0251 family)
MKTIRRPPTQPRKRRAYDEELLRREEEAFRLSYDSGLDDESVGEKMGISGRQARTYISRAKSRQVEALRRAMGVEGGYQIYASLAYAATEAREAWESSKTPEVREEVIMVEDGSGKAKADRMKRTVLRKGPNPAYLGAYIQATLAMSNLLGLGEERLEQTSKEAARAEEVIEDYSGMTAEELLARYRQAMGQN